MNIGLKNRIPQRHERMGQPPSTHTHTHTHAFKLQLIITEHMITVKQQRIKRLFSTLPLSVCVCVCEESFYIWKKSRKQQKPEAEECVRHTGH